MGISQLIVIVASRAAAKSFIIALYACCKAIIKPNSRIVLGSATRGQSKLIISEKIKNELGWEPVTMFDVGIEKTIKWYMKNQNWLQNVMSGEYRKKGVESNG